MYEKIRALIWLVGKSVPGLILSILDNFFILDVGVIY